MGETLKKINRITAALLGTAIIISGLSGCAKNEDEDSSAAETSEGTSVSSSDYSGGLNTNGFYSGITAVNYVTLPEYKGVEVPGDIFKASDADIQTQIDTILKSKTSSVKVMDRAAADGDTVNIDYVGYIDGTAFDGGSTQGAGTSVTIGKTAYIDDFLEQLIGHKPGESFDIEVTFPDDYHAAECAGKDAVFSIVINYISEETAATELTQEIAESYGMTSVEAMIKSISGWIINEQKKNYMETLLISAECPEIPENVMNYVTEQELLQYRKNADSAGLDLDVYFSTYAGYESADAYIISIHDKLEQRAIYSLACQAIAEKEGLDTADCDLDELGYSEYINEYGLPYVNMVVLGQVLVMNFIFDNAVVK